MSDNRDVPPKRRSPSAQIPGLLAVHAIITPECRAGRSTGGAFDEAVRRLRKEYDACQNSANESAKFHLVLMVERKS